MDLADGEVKQGLYRFDSHQSFDNYLEKSYCKTASLIANSAQAVGVLYDESNDHLKNLYYFGKQIGLAFQVVDDILDFTGNDQQLGKPASTDLASGYLTAPALYALEQNPNLSKLIERQFAKEGDLEEALDIVKNSGAISRTRQLAEEFAFEAKDAIKWLPESSFRSALFELPDFVLSRLY